MLIDIVLVFAQGRGGLEDVLTKVSNELVKRGHKVRIFQSYKPMYEEWISTLPEIYFYGLNKSLDKENIHSLSEGYKKCLNNMEDPDIIIATHAPCLSLICEMATKDLEDKKPKIISWIHSMPEYFGGEKLLNKSDAHLAISSYIGEKIKNYVGELAPIYFIGNPVDDTDFNIVNQEKEKLSLLYLGRLSNHEKRLDILFKALSLLDKDWELKIIGSGPDEKKLKQIAKNLNISKSIKWLGWIENPWDNINNITAIVLTSDYEGFPMVVPEALGRGIAVISTNCSGIDDMIKNGENGWIFEKGNYEQLYEILKNINEKKLKLPNPNDCIKSIERFKIDKVVDEIESAILNTYNNSTYKNKLEKIILDISNLISIKDFKSAKKLIYKYKNLFKDDVSIYCMGGFILLEEKNYKEAYEIFKEGLKIDEYNISLLYNLGYTSCLLNNYEKGIDYYSKCLSYSKDDKLNTQIENILNQLINRQSNNYLEKEDIDKTISIYKKLLISTNNKELKSILLENIYKLHDYRRIKYENKNIKKSNENLLSIVILSYKTLDYINNTIDSILNQSYENIELIIGDDCSEEFEIEKYQKYINEKKGENIKNIVIYKNNTNLGTISNANKALSLTNGKYIKFIGSDDVFYSDNAMSEMVKYIKDKDGYVLTSNILYCDSNMEVLNNASDFIQLYRAILPLGMNPIKFGLLMCKENLIPALGVLFKRDVFDIYGMFDEEYMYIEDYPYWMKLINNNENIDYIDIISVKYRYGEGITSNKRINNNFYKDIEKSRNYAKLLKEKLIKHISEENN